MTRYFFHVLDGERLTTDEEGEDLPDIAAAREEGVASAIELVCHSLHLGMGLGPHRTILIMDEHNRIVEDTIHRRGTASTLRRRVS